MIKYNYKPFTHHFLLFASASVTVQNPHRLQISAEDFGAWSTARGRACGGHRWIGLSKGNV